VTVSGSTEATVGDTVQLTAEGLTDPAATYLWTIETGTVEIAGPDNEASVNVTGTAAGDLVVRVVAGEPGCIETTVDTTVTFVPIPTNWLPCDSTGEGNLDLTDVINYLNYNFVGSWSPPCIGALDCDGNGSLDLTDAVQSLNYQFVTGVPPTHPTFGACTKFTQEAGNPDAEPCPVSPGCTP